MSLASSLLAFSLFLSATDAASQATSAEATKVQTMIRTDAIAPVAGARNADVTVVVFSDYQCPYCRKLHPQLQALLASDRKVRVLYRDWPIFGPMSREAARAAIASRWQGKHEAFNDSLMRSSGQLSSTSIRAAAARAGVDWARLQSDLSKHGTEIDALLARTDHYANIMGLEGTPGFLIGSYRVPGVLDLAGLRRLVAKVRAAN